MRIISGFFAGFGVALALTLVLFITGALSTTEMAVVYIALGIIGAILLARIIRYQRKRAAGFNLRPNFFLSRILRSTPFLGSLIGVSIAILVAGIFITQGTPLLPRLTGVIINICITTALISAFQKSKRDSKK